VRPVLRQRQMTSPGSPRECPSLPLRQARQSGQTLGTAPGGLWHFKSIGRGRFPGEFAPRAGFSDPVGNGPGS
jgi:hypothetical protein